MKRAVLLLLGVWAGCQRVSTEPPLVVLEVAPRSPSARAPALVLLHGVGSNERDLVSLAHDFDPRFRVFSVRSPVTLGPDRYGWYPVRFTPEGPVHTPAEAEKARLRLISWLETLRRNPAIDPDRVMLVGFSQGAIMSLAVALTRPDLVHGVVSFSGRVLEEQQAVEGQKPPVLLVHGTRDPVIPFARAQEAAQRLEASGVPVELQTFDAVHEINPQMRAVAAAWLAARL